MTTDQRRALTLLGVAVLLAMTTWFSASAVIPQLRVEWSLSSSAGAWLTIAVQLGFVVGALASAALTLSDRVPPRRLLLLGSLGAAAANLALLGVDSAGPAIALRFLTGAALSAVYPPSLKAIATWFATGRGLALGVMVGALTVGSAVPHLVNALGGLDWRTVIVATSALTVAGGLLAEFAVADGPHRFPSAPFEPRQALAVLRDRRVLLASAGYFGHMWELYAMWAWIGVFFADTYADQGVTLDGRWASLTAFAVIGVGGVGCVVGGRLADRRGRPWLTSVAMGASGAMALVIGASTALPIAVTIAVALIWGFWVVADSAQFSTLVTEVADQRYVGTALTVQLALGFVLTVVTIWLIPVLRDAWSWRWAFVLLVPGPVLGVWAMQRLQALMDREQAAAVGGSPTAA